LFHRPHGCSAVVPTAVVDGVRVEAGLQPFSQKSRTPTVAKEFQIGLYDPSEADLELFRNSWSAGFLGERLYDIPFAIPTTWRDSSRRFYSFAHRLRISPL